jgi:hypothetical protein
MLGGTIGIIMMVSFYVSKREDELFERLYKKYDLAQFR